MTATIHRLNTPTKAVPRQAQEVERLLHACAAVSLAAMNMPNSPVGNAVAETLFISAANFRQIAQWIQEGNVK